MADVSFNYYDLHSHLLPGVDDGCVDLKESLACLQSLERAGCHSVVCTPHMGLPHYRDNTPEQLVPRLQSLQNSASAAGLSIRLHAGGEFRLIEESVDWWQTHGVPVLGRSRYVLLDTWERQWKSHLDNSIDWLLSHNYIPILAHPERMLLETPEWEQSLDELRSRGVLLQGNFKSFADHDRPTVKERAESLLKSDAYYFLASDSHGPASLPSRWQGLDVLRQHLNPDALHSLVWERPKQILEG